MKKVEIIVYQETERVIIDADSVDEYIQNQETVPGIKCVIQKYFDTEERGKAKRSCSGSGRIGKRLGPLSDIFHPLDLNDDE